MQRGRPGTKFFENDQVDAVRIHLERHRKVLPAEVAAKLVHQACDRPHRPDRVRVGLDVRGRQQRRGQWPTQDAEGLDGLRQHIERVLNVWAGLQDPVSLAQLRFQPTELARFRIGGRQGAGPADVAIELVEQQLLRGHADESGIQGLGQPPIHLRLFGGRRALILSGRAIQPHRSGAHVRMPKEGSNIRPQRQRFQCGDVLTGIRPGLVPVDDLNHVVTRYRLHPAEDVPGIDAVDVYDRQEQEPSKTVVTP